MDYRDPETARRRSIFHQRIQIGFPGRSFVVDLQSYFSSLLKLQIHPRLSSIPRFNLSSLHSDFCHIARRFHHPPNKPLAIGRLMPKLRISGGRIKHEKNSFWTCRVPLAMKFIRTTKEHIRNQIHVEILK
uniref:Uncharacterized protein n=1 Tax=Xanthomonas citri pv. phaseoli var. fuscans TaxID=473423 RepID=A0A808FBK6_XANCI